ncbi:MAG: HAD family hydrolase [Clostridiales bacterium]|nr:HAD family hydrolase [Clostridiales bacterium]
MKTYSTIFFDLDGTLTESAEGIINCVIYALKALEQPIPHSDILFKFIGPPLIDSFMNYCSMDKNLAEKAVIKYRERFSTVGLFENRLYDGISELLSLLSERGYTLVLATAKPEDYATRIIEHFDIIKHFTYIAGAQMNESRTHKNEVIAYALSLIKEKDKSRIIMVGDRDNDILGAKDNGLDSLGVLYGYGSRDELSSSGATYIIPSVSALKEFFIKE